MKKGKMTRQGVFLIWSGLLALSAVWAVFKDFNPPWRAYQKEFEKVTVRLAQEEVNRENAKIEALYKKRLEDLDVKIRELSDANRSLNQQKVIDAKQEEIKQLIQKEYEAGQKVSFAKSLLGAARSKYEFLKNDLFATESEVSAVKEKYERYFKDVQELTPAADQAYAELNKAKDELKALQDGPAKFVKEKEAIFAEMQNWKTEVEKIKPTDIVHFTARQARDIPLLDFLGPKYNLKQVVMDDFPDLTKSEKVDRCQTCHMGIADPRFSQEGVPAVFKSHPQLDLYVGPNSPHPAEKFGCTSCHQGRGYGTSFTLASHTPNNEEEAEAWKKKYGWSDMHYWDYPMLPRKNMQAMCFSCHKQALGYELTAARQIFEGRKIYERRGCHGCHKIEGVSDDMKKIGPTLEKVTSKLDPNWIPKWISGPRNFYSTARMPHPFGHRIPTTDQFPEYLEHLEKATDEGHLKEIQTSFVSQRKSMESDEAVMIDSISTYLIDKSKPAELEEPPAQPGDAAKGKELVERHNCLGCHKLEVLGITDNDFAPDLSKIGSKTNRKWIYNWIKHPTKYWPDTRMPDPRLTEEEANDVTAYLVTLKDDEYMAKETPPVPSEAVEEMAVRFLRSKLPETEAKAKVAKLDDHGRKMLIGEEAIYRNGCFGCHDIPGFEGRQRIGAELTAEGFKEIERFDFGMHKYVHIPHTRHDWVDQKVRQPYVYFLGKVINPYEQELRMPWFGFSREDAAKITTFILGQTGKPAPDKYKYDPRGDKLALLEGRKIIERRNCVGCHKVGAGDQIIQLGKFDFAEHKVWAEDPIVATYDKNLPEGKFASVAQVKEAAEKDRVIVDRKAWILGETVLGKDYFSIPDDILTTKPVQVDVGSTEVQKVALDKPESVKVFGVGEGHIAELKIGQNKIYEDASMAPPVLREEGAKVRPEWLFKWLKNVTTVRNHIEVRMPQWEWSDADATAIVRYFSAAAAVPFPYETETVAQLTDDPNDPIHKTAKEIFGLPGTPEYDNSLKCFSCHPAGELMPTNPKESWGPNLYLAHDRLKISFINSWLHHPPGWAPGTRMPGYFYESDGGVLKEVKQDAPAIAALGVPETISRLANMLYHLPELKEVDAAAKAAIEQQKKAPPPAAAKKEAGEEFMEDDTSGKDAKKKDAKDNKDEEFIEEDEKKPAAPAAGDKKPAAAPGAPAAPADKKPAAAPAPADKKPADAAKPAK